MMCFIRLIRILFWTSFFFCITFVYSNDFVDALILPKRIVFIFFVFILVLMKSLLIFINKKRINVLPQVNDLLFSISITIMALSFYGIFQYCGIINTVNNNFISGTYDNPAGFAASISSAFPFLVYGMKNNKYRKFYQIVAIISIIALLLSQSRAGIISVLIIGVLYVYLMHKSSMHIWHIRIVISVFVFIVIALFFFKPDSVLGRFLIWRCCIDMIRYKLLFGYGYGGFEANYMDYQAEYFRNNPYSQYSWFADTVQYPFNEYLYIMINYGVVGLLGLLLFLSYLVRCYFKRKSEIKFTAMIAVFSIAIFALFSYPLMYPFVWAILLYSVVILCLTSPVIIVKNNWYIKLIAIIAVILCCYIGYTIYTKMSAELAWGKILIEDRHDSAQLSEYEYIYTLLHDNRYFMYNYTYVLYTAGEYEKAAKTAAECRNLWADYDLEILTGLIYEDMGNLDMAEIYYLQASYMCPVRFRPLYLLMRLYASKHEHEKAMCYARRIIDKPVKIPSPEVSWMQKEAKIYLAEKK